MNQTFILIEDEKFEKIADEINKVLKFSTENNIKVEILRLIEKSRRLNMNLELSILEKLASSKFEKLLVKKIKNKEKDFLIDYIFGENVTEKISNYGIGGLLLYFEYSNNSLKEKLKLLNSIRKSEDNILSGVANALIGDVYLIMSNFKLAFEYYKRALEILPEISKFIKPVIDDLKAKIDPTIDGVFEEIKNYYMKNKEFFAELSNIFNVEELKRLYLISDTDYAKYVSAVYYSKENKEKAKELLDQIKNKDSFQFFEYRYAKLLERSENQEELKKAYEMLLKACEKNNNIGDLGLGKYQYDGFYPFANIDSKDDEIIWVGNISEKHSGLGVISPIRAWKKRNGIIYAYPFPTDEALKIYKKRLNTISGLPKFFVAKNEIIRILNEFEINELSILEDDDELKKYVKDICENEEIDFKEDSKIVVSLEAINTLSSLKGIFSDIQKGIFFYFIPDFNNKDDMLWYFPYFRVFRTKKQIDDVLKANNYNKIKHTVLNKNLRVVIFEK
ncbi:MAG TPA: hypothetical protein DER56_00550 [Thermosipho africanus]|nr:hypothetical protein [Thermosipho africanus]